MRGRRQFGLGLLQNRRERSRVRHVPDALFQLVVRGQATSDSSPVTLEFCPDLNRPITPEISANVPVEGIGECALVERLDVEPIGSASNVSVMRRVPTDTFTQAFTYR